MSLPNISPPPPPRPPPPSRVSPSTPYLASAPTHSSLIQPPPRFPKESISPPAVLRLTESVPEQGQAQSPLWLCPLPSASRFQVLPSPVQELSLSPMTSRPTL